MTDEDVRVAFTTRMVALVTAYPTTIAVKYDNRDTFRAEDENVYVDFQVHFVDSYQADISPSPNHRTLGMLTVAVYAKEGRGSKEVNDVLEYFGVGLQQHNFSPVRTYMQKRVQTKTAKGWWGQAKAIPFEFDRQY